MAISTLAGAPGAAEWEDAPPLPDPRWHHAAAASADGYVMAFGGRMRVGPKRKYQHGVREYGIDVYDPAKKRWARGPKMEPFRRRYVHHYARGVIAPGTRKQMYVPAEKASVNSSDRFPYELPFGGADRLGRAHYFVSSGSVFFDPKSGAWGQEIGPIFHSKSKWNDRWIEGGTAPAWRRSAGATATAPDGRMYLVGGLGARKYDNGKGGDTVLGTLEIYDPATDQWSEAAPMKVPRQQLGAAFSADGKLYVFGGCSCLGGLSYKPGNLESERRAREDSEAMKHPVAVAEVYDPATNSWSDRAPIPTPRMSLSAAAGRDGRI
ncbi:MAG: hypothetical protein WEF50_11320 [Myxococcota bacterium]